MNFNEIYLNFCNWGPRTKRNIYILCFYWYTTHKEGIIRSMLLLVSDHFWRISPCPDFLAPCKIGKMNRMNYPINRIKSKWPSNYYLTLPCHSPKSRPVWRSPWIYSSKDFVKMKKIFSWGKRWLTFFVKNWFFTYDWKGGVVLPRTRDTASVRFVCWLLNLNMDASFCCCWPVSIFCIRHWPRCRLQLCHKISLSFPLDSNKLTKVVGLSFTEEKKSSGKRCKMLDMKPIFLKCL